MENINFCWLKPTLSVVESIQPSSTMALFQLDETSSSAVLSEDFIASLHSINQLILRWQNNPTEWNQLLLQAFGRSSLLDLSDITVEILNGQTMAGLYGAYAPVAPDGNERIYINEDWLATANANAIKAVLLEELGHAIDHRLNQGNDTTGDEGAIFSALIQNRAVDLQELNQNDHSELNISGQRIKIEASSITSSVSYIASDGVVNITLTGSDNIDATGNALDNTLIGNSGANLLIGGDGNDTLTGGNGADVFQLGGGDDQVIDFSLASGDQVGIEAWQNYTISQVGNDALITVASVGSVRLTNFDSESWDEEAYVERTDASGNAFVGGLGRPATLTSATYNASSGALTVTGTNLASKSGAGNDIDVSTLTITGEGGNTYTLTTSDVELTSATTFSITFNATDQLQLAGLLNNNGTSSSSGTTYNIAAALSWNTGNFSPADSTGNAITVSNVSPSLTSATYNDATGVLALSGSNLPAYPGANNDIDVSKLTITGGSGSTYTLTSSDVELTSATAASITLNSSDQSNLDSLLNKNGSASTQGTTYNIAAADDWAPGADSTNDIADLTGNAVTVSDIKPTIAITDDDVDDFLSEGDTATITFTLSEASSNFVQSDVTVSGGSLSNWNAASATSYSATFTPTAESTTDGVISVASNKFCDSDGNLNLDGSDSNNSATFSVDTRSSSPTPSPTPTPTPASSPTPEPTPAPEPEPTPTPSNELPAVVSAFNSDHVATLTPDVVSELSADQLRDLPPAAIEGFTSVQVAELSTNAVTAFTQKQIKQLSPEAVSGLSKAQVSELSTKAIRGFSADQIELLPRRSFKALESVQLAKLSKDAVTGLTSSQLKTLSGDELAAFKPGKIKAISAESITGLKPAALDDLNNRQIKVLTTEQLAALTKKQIKKADDLIDALSDQQREALSFDPDRSNRLVVPLDRVNGIEVIAGQDPLE